MEFYKYLYETEESKERRKRSDDNSIRVFAPIEAGNGVMVSIQASEIVSSKPKGTFEVERYTHMEVALFDKGEFAKIEDIAPYFSSVAEFETYKSEEIYTSVPVDLIDEFFQYYVLKRDERLYV